MPTAAECQQVAVTTPGTATTGVFAANPVSGDAMLVLVSTFKTGASVTHNTPTDTAGNVYTQIGTTLDNQAASVADRIELSLWKKENMTGGASFTVTATTTPAASALTVVAWHLTSVGTYNSDTAGTIGSTANPNSGASSPTPPASSLAIGAMTTDAVSAPTNGSGWVSPTNANQTDNSTFQELWSEDQTISATIAADWTRSATHWSARVASFAAGGSFASAQRQLHRPFTSKPSGSRLRWRN